MEFTKFFNLCCPSNKDSDAGKEFHINNHISFNESKEANYIDNSDFTYFTKKNKIEIEDHLNLAPISKNINNYENENTSEVLLPNINYTSPLDFHKKTLQNIHQSTLNYEIDKKNFILNNLENQAKIKEKSKSIDHTKNVKSIIFDENEKDNSYIINQQANRIDKMDNLNLSMRKKNEEENSNYEIFSSFPVITEEEVNNADIIQIEELDGNLLFNKKLIIMASGLINGARKSSDGVVFFGTKLIKNNIIINDFVINIENDNLTHTFIIYYKRETKKYYLKSYKERESSNVSLVLVKIEDKFIIKKKHILKIGDIYFQFLPGNDKIEIFRLESKTYERKKYEFSSNSVIKIGRNKMCTIAFPDDKSLSRIQCTLKFDNGNWEIIDGYDKLSTNGTWVYIQNSFEINKNEMIVRINNSLIKLSLKENIYSSFFKNLK